MINYQPSRKKIMINYQPNKCHVTIKAKNRNDEIQKNKVVQST